MRMVMAVDAVRCPAVKAAEFFELRCYHIGKRACQPWMENYLAEAVPGQVSGKVLLMFLQALWSR